MATSIRTSRDEVDFVNSMNNNNNNSDCYKNNLNQHFKQNKVPKSSFNEKVTKFLINKNNNNNNNYNNNSGNDGSSSSKLDTKPKEGFTLLGFGRKLEEFFDKKDAKLNKKVNKVGTNGTNDTIKQNLKYKFLENGYPTNSHTHKQSSINTYVSSSSLTRLLAKKGENEAQSALNEYQFNTFSGQRRSGVGLQQLERFKRCTKEDIDPTAQPIKIKNFTKDFDLDCTNINGNKISNEKHYVIYNVSDNDVLALQHFQEPPLSDDLSTKAMRTLSRSLGKLIWRRANSVKISSPDREYKVSYLGNVLTGWAKGEGCVEKQLNTLWRNYTQNNKPNVIMRIKVCASGLKATTRQHGLTEYWANRITHCCAPKNYPRIFCWIYRHEGRKLKHELRCHAVLCNKEKIVQEICDTLKTNLECALREFKREKILKQNARLSLANAVYDNPSLPRRKILLSVGSNNYRPPLERSKSAPKLVAIEEAIGQEGEEMEETNEPEMKSCCQKDSLYPAMTLGRRHCRRGHSIRRTGKARPLNCTALNKTCDEICPNKSSNPTEKTTNNLNKLETITFELSKINEKLEDPYPESYNYDSNDSDDFEKILKYNDYDATTSLTAELMPYFERQLHKQAGSCKSLTVLNSFENQEDNNEPLSLIPTINNDPNARPENDFCNVELCKEEQRNKHFSNIIINMRRSGVCSDGEDEFSNQEEKENANDLYFRQEAILNMLHRHSIRKIAQLSLNNKEASSALEIHNHHPQSYILSDKASITDGGNGPLAARRQRNVLVDNTDDSSISSGCETSSTMTNNQDEITTNYTTAITYESNFDKAFKDKIMMFQNLEPLTPDLHEHERRCGGNDDRTTITRSRSSSITNKLSQSSSNLVNKDEMEQTEHLIGTSIDTKNGHFKIRRIRNNYELPNDSDSEYSDESGYAEYQEKELKAKNIPNEISKSKPTTITKPVVPPKPMPRRSLVIGPSTTTII